jgi:xanthine dehydrogenase accessory factor
MSAVKIWKLIAKSLEQHIPVMLLYVLESKGSSPGRQGFFMAVNTNQEMEGSIGGGIMEHKFVETAKKSLESIADSREYGGEGTERGAGRPASEIRKQVHDKSATKDQSGMICSGEQTILFYPAKEKDLPVIQNIISSLEENKNGTLTLSPEEMQFDFSVPEKDFEYSFQSEAGWLYKEKTGYKNQLFIIGGGHCSLAFSRLMRQMDFYIRVYDERKDLKTMVENETAHEKYFVNDYAVLKDMIPSGRNSYVVIMTFGYRTDDAALRAVLGKDFKYLGLLGSNSKIEKMLEDYRQEGIKDELLRQIRTPIGLPINSQTPEEIAISIAAEIIGVKNGRSKSQEPRTK